MLSSFQGLSFLSIPYTNLEFSWMSKILDYKLRKIKIPVTEMENDSGYFVDKKKDKMDEGIIGKIETNLSKLLFNNPRITVGDESTCNKFVERIDFMYKVKNGVHYPLEDRADFNRAYATYANNNKAPEEVEETDKFVLRYLWNLFGWYHRFQ